MIHQKESKQVRMDSLLLKLPSSDMKTKTKNKDQPTIIKNNRKIKKRKKSKSSGKYNTYHGPLSQKWIDGRYRSLIWYVMLTQVMSNLLPWFRFRIRIHSQQTLSRLYWIKTQHSWLKTTRHTKRKEPHNGILGLKSPDMFQTSNLTES